ncbi:MAG: alpha-amylase, partial [Desulfuromonas sp.]
MMASTLADFTRRGGPVFLANRICRQRLTETGLQHLHDTPLDLATARQLAHRLEVNGTRLFLLAQLNAALQWLCLRYLDHHAIEVHWQEFRLAEEPHIFPTLGQILCRFQDEYALRDLPKGTVQPQGHGDVVVTARRSLVAAICLLDIQSNNPALNDLVPLFIDQSPTHRQDYKAVLDRLTELWPEQQESSLWDQPLRTLLEAPRKAAPFNLEGQLDYVLDHWSDLLPEELIRNLTVAQAIVREESQQRAPGPGPTPLPEFGKTEGAWEPAAFTPDTDWMPKAVLLAKSIHVWLGQLSRQYYTPITTLQQIPDAELDRLAGWGINALWLIGIWQRSKASRTIKQMRGNPEAEASAYALDNYRVAADLGGEEALDNLAARCTARGIRLACDVVPNHTGIDSEWVRHHPDWFIQSEHPPYPAYHFSGPDLCDDPAISIRIEDGYWDNSDAAVTFEHLDHRTGRRRYIYHGNDGTHMPWNDTAQLNFLLPEVRRMMSDLIVDVARRFRLIRFDAAMTLARKHFRR